MQTLQPDYMSQKKTLSSKTVLEVPIMVQTDQIVSSRFDDVFFYGFMGTGVLKLSTTCPAVLKPVIIDVFLPLPVSSDSSPLKYIKKD